MLDDKDIKKLIGAFKEVFPTAEMVQEGFNDIGKQVEKLEMKVGKIDERLKNLEVTLQDIGDLRPRVKTLEDAMGI